MSRTGVECRVLIDGNRLDDGCIDWGSISPPVYSDWLETRRNRIINPAPIATGWTAIGATADFSSGHGVWTSTGAYASTTQPRGQLVVAAGATPVVAGETYFLRMEVKHSRGLTMEIRPWFMNGTGGQVTYHRSPTVAATFDWKPVSYSDVVPAGATLMGYQVVVRSDLGVSAIGDVFEARRITMNPGLYFDGNTISTVPNIRFRWVGAADGSASVEETAQTVTPGPPPDGYMPRGVSAEDGLQITWGRATTVDQPESSSCTFTVVDDPGGVGVLEALRIGARVDVLADADAASTGGTGPPFIDPSFSTQLRTTTSNARTSRVQWITEDAGGFSAEIHSINPAAPSWVRFPPGPLQPAGTNPAAWSDIPTIRPGETWSVSVRVASLVGVGVTLRPVLYAGPYANAATVLTTPSVTVMGTGAWQTARFDLTPGTTAWVGFQLEPIGAIPWQGIDPASTWNSFAPMSWDTVNSTYVDTVTITPPAPGPPTTVGVFSGRITDLEGFWDDSWNAAAMNVTASDFLADLGNRNIGAEPWPVESVSVRFGKILELAAIPGEPAVAVQMAPTLAAIPLTGMDVDSRPAAGMLTDIAQSVDGVLWSSAHPVTGPFVRLEDPAQRIALYRLALVGGVIVIVPVDLSRMAPTPPELSACDLLRDPVQFRLSVSDVATRVDATYQEQPIAPATDTTERHVKVIDTDAEIEYGTRRVSIQTDLISAGETTRVAQQLIARLSAAWRIDGVVFSDADVVTPDAAATATLVTLLDSVTRGGQPVLITDLDEWSPVGDTAPVYVEGGTYSFVGGGWSLSLIVTRSFGVGTSVTWAGVPAVAGWTWAAFDPAISWNDLRGVAGPALLKRKE